MDDRATGFRVRIKRRIVGCSEEIDRTRSGNRTESETRSRDFPWVPSTTNDPAAVPRDTPSAALDHATLTWAFWDREPTPVVLFLWSKVIGNVPFIEKRGGGSNGGSRGVALV